MQIRVVRFQLAIIEIFITTILLPMETSRAQIVDEQAEHFHQYASTHWRKENLVRSHLRRRQLDSPSEVLMEFNWINVNLLRYF